MSRPDGAAAPRIGYYCVWDPSYPRNRRIREYLQHDLGADVTVHRRSTLRWKPMRIAAELLAPILTMRGHDVIVVSEYAVNFAPVLCCVARLARRPIVVDGFVSKHESEVEDWGRHGSRSVAARVYALVDRLAATMPDLYLTDTEVRAERVMRRYPGRCAAMALPVGAPAWAAPRAAPARDGALRVLFYGLYVPLHGVETILRAASIVAAAAPNGVRVTMVGDGELHAAAVALAARLGLAGTVRFMPPVDETSLAAIIAEHDVVLGVFGRSSQAETVIPNKVLQGLACGRTVVTRDSPALAEIESIVGDQLVTVPPADAEALAAALLRIARQGVRPAAPEVAEHLESSVRERFRGFGAAIDRLGRRTGRRHGSRHEPSGPKVR